MAKDSVFCYTFLETMSDKRKKEREKYERIKHKELRRASAFYECPSSCKHIGNIQDDSLKTLGTDAKRVRTESLEKGAKTVYVEFASGKAGEMRYFSEADFTVDAKFGFGKEYSERINDGVIFVELIKDMLRFFTDGTVSFDTAQTLAVSLVREAAIKSSGNWIELL